jgi:hypothetical protein
MVEDTIVATFCSIDLTKNKLNTAIANIEFTGDADTGWSLTIDSTKEVPFGFLKKVNTDKRIAYVAISYLAKS